MKIEHWSIDRPKPYDKNPRKIGERAITKVAASIKEFGFRWPILVDKNEVIIAGHTRQAAARLLGLAKVPVIRADDLTPAQVKAFRIADNRVAEESKWDDDLLGEELSSLGEMDFELGLTGFETVEIDQLLADGENDAEAEWDGMPEYSHSDKSAFRTIPVHFRHAAAVEAFAALVGLPITGKTRFLWYPETEIERYADKRYAAATPEPERKDA
jgi:ParB-like chromosome segregation protein Spo0J